MRREDISLDDILHFHSRGQHGNYYPDHNRFNPSLFREDCPWCQARLFISGMREIIIGTD